MSIEVVFEKRINNANVYRDVDVAQRRQYFLLTFLSAMFVVGLLLYGWQQFRWLDLGYDIETLSKQKELLLEDRHRLQVDRETWRSAKNIDSTARKDLGMAMAAPGQIVSVTREEMGGPAPTTDVAVR